MSKFLRRAATFVASALLLCSAPLAFAQAGGGTITGKVVDAQGAILPGVTVVATNAAGRIVKTGQTDGSGVYKLDVAAGEYNVAVSLSGFATVDNKKVVVTAGGSTTVDTMLKVGGLSEEIMVTAQRRETALQSTPIAISAFSGDTLAQDKIFTVTDLANDVPAFSLTAGTPLDVELNVRGITNTRLDSPSADPSVGTFVDGVYMGRTGDLNFDFYDLERIEVIRGPQGVLLGKNVVGGALNIITAKPSYQNSGNLVLSYGNYNAKLASGYVTGKLSNAWAGRFSFQSRTHDGYGYDALHDREVENLDSLQARAQLLYHSDSNGWTARTVLDVNKDSTNGLNVIAIASEFDECEATYLRTNCSRPWSNLRRFLGLTDSRVNLAQSVLYRGETSSTQQFMKRRGTGGLLDLQKDFSTFSFNSLTGVRDGRGDQMYDQTGIGPEALGYDPARFAQFVAFVAATRPAGRTDNGALLFAEPVREQSNVKQFSQEFRFTSNNPDSKLEWIAGAYIKHDSVDKIDRFSGEGFGVLPTLSGETKWNNFGKIDNRGVFAQIAYKASPKLKLSAGVRYTYDKKSGNVDGTAIATGDRLQPNDTVALTPLAASFRAGTGFTAPYSANWSKTTPQATLDYTHSKDLYFYATVATGFKGGGYDDTPTNAAAAQIPYDPETVTNFEGGFKSTLFERKVRLNLTGFRMNYKNLQVVQTNAACLCNLTDNAANAKLQGIEAEFELAPVNSFKVFASGSYVDAKYKDFIETAINPTTGQRLVSSGNRLQRTPKSQVSVGVDLTTRLAKWSDALNFRVNYTWQSDLKWATDNVVGEPSYGLLDARVGLAPRGAKWGLSFYGKNLNDKLYRVNIINFFGEEVSQYGIPRTYGADLTFSFH